MDLVVGLFYQLLFTRSRTNFQSQFLSRHEQEVLKMLRKKMEIQATESSITSQEVSCFGSNQFLIRLPTRSWIKNSSAGKDGGFASYLIGGWWLTINFSWPMRSFVSWTSLFFQLWGHGFPLTCCLFAVWTQTKGSNVSYVIKATKLTQIFGALLLIPAAWKVVLCVTAFLKTQKHVPVNSHGPFLCALSCCWKHFFWHDACS